MHGSRVYKLFGMENGCRENSRMRSGSRVYYHYLQDMCFTVLLHAFVQFKVYILKSCIHLDFIKYENINIKLCKTTNKNQNLVRAFSDVLVTFIYFDIYHLLLSVEYE